MIYHNPEIIAECSSQQLDLLTQPHTLPSFRTCSRCRTRKLLERGFYRDRKSRDGYRRECKKCRNRVRALWARSRYQPRTGRRRTGRAPAAQGGCHAR